MTRACAGVATVATLLCALSADVLAMADMEAHRRGERVEYADGTSVETRCDDVDRCSLTVSDGKASWTIAHEDMDGLYVLPKQLVLLGPPRDGRFSVQVEIACAEYSEGLPAHTCLAQLTFADGKLVSHLLIRDTVTRTFDAVPFRAPPPAAAGEEKTE